MGTLEEYEHCTATVRTSDGRELVGTIRLGDECLVVCVDEEEKERGVFVVNIAHVVSVWIGWD